MASPTLSVLDKRFPFGLSWPLVDARLARSTSALKELHSNLRRNGPLRCEWHELCKSVWAALTPNEQAEVVEPAETDIASYLDKDLTVLVGPNSVAVAMKEAGGKANEIFIHQHLLQVLEDAAMGTEGATSPEIAGFLLAGVLMTEWTLAMIRSLFPGKIADGEVASLEIEERVFGGVLVLQRKVEERHRLDTAEWLFEGGNGCIHAIPTQALEDWVISVHSAIREFRQIPRLDPSKFSLASPQGPSGHPVQCTGISTACSPPSPAPYVDPRLEFVVDGHQVRRYRGCA
ncbi:hypothetical protein JCM10213_000206 [Rhodosporidiobolus nylandii]